MVPYSICCFPILPYKIPFFAMPTSLTEATSKTVIIPMSNVDFISVLPMIMERGAEC